MKSQYAVIFIYLSKPFDLVMFSSLRLPSDVEKVFALTVKYVCAPTNHVTLST